ncbi:MAG TPA: tripartite tricarboxylate transporter substrate binding protein [Xanthobacteraceae bacterium]|jgi:tripartite-type tricarboxylate transporter receptor subunit TctC|nr:tripartite tricarboxylate transporter substrate binding protein [Xanthobacteraceae bacterium]
MKATRSLWVAGAAALALSFCQIAAHAQDAAYPNRPIKMLVGFGAGGGTDIAARIMAQKMSEILGQSIVVENRTGASGMIAAEDEAKSAPDGYTLMMGSQTTYAVAPNLYRKVTLDAAKEFAGVAMTGASPLVLVVNRSFAAQSVKDVIAMAKADPGKINFGTGGLGTTPHMTAELFQYTAGIKMVHVAYRGEAPAINDLLAGQIPLMFANLSAVMGNLKAGTLRALAVTGAHRSPSAPDIPTVAEAALPGFEAETWWGIVAPAGTPPAILAKLNAAARNALADDDTKKRFADLGMTNGGSSPEELDAYIKSEIAKWSKVIKDANIQPMD